MDPRPDRVHYTGVVCHRCSYPVAVIGHEQETGVDITCPACGHTWLAPPPLKLRAPRRPQAG
jgi:DNA-directed RNA polymerase subunit RPC12/RpoP